MGAGLFLLTGVLTYALYLVVNEVDEKFQVLNTISKEVDDILNDAAGITPPSNTTEANIGPTLKSIKTTKNNEEIKDEEDDMSSVAYGQSSSPKTRLRVLEVFDDNDPGLVKRQIHNKTYVIRRYDRSRRKGLWTVKKRKTRQGQHESGHAKGIPRNRKVKPNAKSSNKRIEAYRQKSKSGKNPIRRNREQRKDKVPVVRKHKRDHNKNKNAHGPSRRMPKRKEVKPRRDKAPSESKHDIFTDY